MIRIPWVITLVLQGGSLRNLQLQSLAAQNQVNLPRGRETGAGGYDLMRTDAVKVDGRVARSLEEMGSFRGGSLIFLATQDLSFRRVLAMHLVLATGGGVGLPSLS